MHVASGATLTNSGTLNLEGGNGQISDVGLTGGTLTISFGGTAIDSGTLTIGSGTGGGGTLITLSDHSMILLKGVASINPNFFS